MNIKKILGEILGGVHVVDKSDSHECSKKLDFDLYSKVSYGKKLYPQNTDIPSTKNKVILKDLGGKMNIRIRDDKIAVEYKVRCSEKTKIKEIYKILGFPYGIIIFNGETLSDDKTDKTLEYYGIEEDDVLILNSLRLGGGDEFYIDDDLLDPSYDYDFRGIDDRNQKFYRGGLEYKRPIGWKRYALKVNGRYENDKWLGDTEWAVSYKYEVYL